MKKQIKLNPEQKFLEYLYEITPNEKLREYAAEYFSIFKETYKGQFLSKEDFDTLRIEQPDGSFITYEQDVVRDLFRTRNQVPYDEVFYYLFKKNIKSFDSFFDFDINLNGFLDTYNKKLAVKLASSIQEYDFMKNRKIQIENIFNLKHRDVTFHELSHIFEIKSYNNNKYIVSGFTDHIILRNRYSISPQNAGQVDKNFKIVDLDKIFYNNNLGNFYFDQYANNGKYEISEILNEDFSLNAIHKGMVLYDSVDINQKFISKKRYGQNDTDGLEFKNSYHKNYDILLLIKYALPNFNYKNFRFNTSKTIGEINNLDIDQIVTYFAANVYKKLAIIDTLKDGKGELVTTKVEWGNVFEKASIYDLIAYGVGFESNYKTENKNNFNYKTISQTLLVNAIKNKIFAELKDKKVKKDFNYFVKLNDQLTMMDKFLIYKNEPIDNKDLYPFEVYSIEKMCEKYSDSLYCQQFGQMNELIYGIKSYINHLPESSQLAVKNIMKFFKKQKQLDDSLEEKLQKAKILNQTQVSSPENKNTNEIERAQ